MLDAQVQICLIDLAAEWVETLELDGKSPEGLIKLKAARFDQAYQDILKTILSSGFYEVTPSKGKGGR